MGHGVIGGNRPDLTPAQLVAGIPILAELLHAFGLYNLSQAQQDSLARAVTFCFGLLGADAAVRIGRNLKDARVESTALAQSGQPPVGPTDPSSGGDPPEGTAAEVPAEAPLDPEQISDIEFEDPELDEGPALESDPELDADDPDLDEDADADLDPDLDEELGPVGDPSSTEDGKG